MSISGATATDERPDEVERLLAEVRQAGQAPRRELLDRVLALGPTAARPLIAIATDDDLHNAAADSPDVWAPIHAVRLLGELEVPDSVAPLLRLLDHDDEEWLAEALPEALGRIGQPALAPLRAFLFDRGRTIWARAMAARALTAIAREHAEQRPEVVAALAARLEPAESRAPDDETLNAFVVSELLELQAIEAAPAIVRAYEEDRIDRRIVALVDVRSELGLPAGPEPARPTESDGMRLWLRCTACGYEREHAVGTVYCDLGTQHQRERGEETPYGPYVITRSITCPKCGAVDQYDLSTDAYLALTTAALELLTRPGGRRAPDDAGAERLVPIRFTLADGREMHPLAAREMYRQEVEAEPGRAEPRVRYGNVLRFLGHRDEAVRQYEAALATEPDNVEAALNLGMLAREAGDAGRARREFARVVELAPASRLPSPERESYRRFAEAALGELDGGPAPYGWDVGPRLARPASPLAMAPTPSRQSTRAAVKVGRNDPCPCGSGRKYKKCCGR
jgi:tetratricopeptide (TPR) repeat protein